jgi:hypothetical protein
MLDCPKLFYCAYLCANEEPAYTFEEFTALIPFDLEICAKLFQKLTISKKKIAFREAFKCSKPKTRIKLPKFELEDIEDYYTYYVHILGFDTGLFWYADISFLRSVSENNAAFDNYVNYQQEKALNSR